MKQVKIIEAYHDKKMSRYVESGESFEVTDDRADVLLKAGVAEIVEVVDDEAKPKRRGRKKSDQSTQTK